MRAKIGCVLPIFQRHGEESLFLGSGVLVNKDHVLTCEHVVSVDSPNSKPKSLYISAEEPVVVDSVIAADPARDLALLRLSRSLNRQSAFFIDNLGGEGTKSLLSGIRVCGFQEVGGIAIQSRATIREVSLHVNDEKSDQLLEVQINGGVPEGYSGGLAMVKTDTGWSGIGLTQLGGKRSATSRMLATAVLAEFCRENNVSFEVHTQLDGLIGGSQVATVFRTIPDDIDVRQWLKSLFEDPELKLFSSLTDSKLAHLKLSCASDVIRLASRPQFILPNAPSSEELTVPLGSQSSVSGELYAGLYQEGPRYRITLVGDPPHLVITALDNSNKPIKSLILKIVLNKVRTNES